LPTYNRRELVQDAIEGALAQTFPSAEVIVVDDGSTDGTAEALERFGDRIAYVRQPHAGVAAARNAGLRHARGDLIAFLDADDLWLPDHLVTMAELFARFPEGIVATTSPNCGLRGRRSAKHAQLRSALPQLLIDNTVGYPTCMAVRRAALDAAGAFDEQLEFASDADMWLRLALRGDFVFLRRRTAVMRKPPDSLMERGRRAGAYLDAMHRITQRLLDDPASDARTRRWIEGRLRFVEALAAIARHAEDDARQALDDACRLLPALSDEAALVSGRLRFVLPQSAEPEERLYHLSTAARLWPAPGSDTALTLRLLAALRALRLGRRRNACSLLRGLPFSGLPTFTLRQRHSIGRSISTFLSGGQHIRQPLRDAG
jgi:hypothetical protein